MHVQKSQKYKGDNWHSSKPALRYQSNRRPEFGNFIEKSGAAVAVARSIWEQ